MSIAVSLSEMEAIMQQAGAIARKYFGLGREAMGQTTKANDTPVTRADREIADYLKQALLAKTPGAAWLCEEDAEDESRLKSELVWIIDPLDGTKEFTRGLPEVAISVACVKNGQPLLGAVVNPITGEAGYWREGGNARFEGFAARGAPPAQKLDEAIASVSRTEYEKGSIEVFRSGLAEARPLGSVAYKLLCVAAGKEDLYFSVEPKSEWDICGGIALVWGAAKSYIRFDAKPVRFNEPSTRIRSGAVAGAQALAQKFLEANRGKIELVQSLIEQGIVR